MFKKLIAITAISLVSAAAYADGSINVKVKANTTNWKMNGKDIISYQFNNTTEQTMNFTIHVDASSTTSIAIWCLNKGKPMTDVVDNIIAPGATFSCTATDAIKMSGDEGKTASGFTSIVLQ